jgi:hypothetical protein
LAKREKDPRLQALFDAGKNVYSISKANTIEECLYEAYNTYILHNKGVNGIYGVLGTRIHDQLEAIVQGEAAVDTLPDVLNQELMDLDLLGLEFPKDFKGNDSIRDNWIADMKHFCNTFQPPKGRFRTEELVLYKLSDDRYIQGYIDLIRENSDGTISIYDWKTSTDFKTADLIHHGRQLVFYALAKEAEGYKVRDVSWIMLKYCEVKFMGKKRSNSKTKTEMVKVLNRGKLISELKNHIECDLTELGYDEIDIEIMLKAALKDNSFDPLPDEIKSKYIVKPYVRKYEITDELRQETIDYLNRQADLFESLDTNNAESWSPRKFTRINGNGKEVEDIFFCRNLCNFRNSCVHLKRYLDDKALNSDREDWENNLF